MVRVICISALPAKPSAAPQIAGPWLDIMSSAASNAMRFAIAEPLRFQYNAT
jgi:hypothetical protein